MRIQTLLGWGIILLIVGFSLYALWVSVGGVGAESISDCLTASPNDREVVAVQVPDTGNVIVWATEPYVQRMLRMDFVTLDERDTIIVLSDGEAFRRVYYWTDSWRRMGLLYEFGGEIFLFVFGDDRQPGVKIDRGASSDWHGTCMLQLTSAP